MDLQKLEKDIKKTSRYIDGKVIIINENGERVSRENVKNVKTFWKNGIFSSTKYLRILFMDDTEEEFVIDDAVNVNGIELD